MSSTVPIDDCHTKFVISTRLFFTLFRQNMWIMWTLLKWKPLASYPSTFIAQIIFCQLFRRPLNLILAAHDIWNNPWSWRSHPKPMRVSETCALVKLLQLGGHQLSGELGRSGYKDRPSANNHHRKMLLNSSENTNLKMFLQKYILSFELCSSF